MTLSPALTAPAAIALVLAGCSPGIPLPTPQELAVAQIGYGPLGAVQLSWRLVLRVSGYRVHFDTRSHQSWASATAARTCTPVATTDASVVLDGPTGQTMVGHCGTNRLDGTYGGTGVAIVKWASGCGDFDGGARATSTNGDAGARDGKAVDVTPSDAMPVDAGRSDLTPAEAGAPDTRSKPDAPWPNSGLLDSPIWIPGEWCLEREDTYGEAGIQPQETPGARPRVRLQNLVADRTYYFAIEAVRGSASSELSNEVAVQVLRARPKANP
jgi:hypothetical protein